MKAGATSARGNQTGERVQARRGALMSSDAPRAILRAPLRDAQCRTLRARCVLRSCPRHKQLGARSFAPRCAGWVCGWVGPRRWGRRERTTRQGKRGGVTELGGEGWRNLRHWDRQPASGTPSPRDTMGSYRVNTHIARTGGHVQLRRVAPMRSDAPRAVLRAALREAQCRTLRATFVLRTCPRHEQKGARQFLPRRAAGVGSER